MRPAPALAAAMIGIAGGLGVVTFDYAEGLSYLSNEPTACVNCHVMNDMYDSWHKSSHHGVAACNDCHVPDGLVEKYWVKARNGWNHSKAFTLQNFHEPISITPANLRVLQHNCIACHTEMVSEIAGHADVQLGEARCTDCHGSVGHLRF
jgi:cytochrome c nitrite reductase small subunit